MVKPRLRGGVFCLDHESSTQIGTSHGRLTSLIFETARLVEVLRIEFNGLGMLVSAAESIV